VLRGRSNIASAVLSSSRSSTPFRNFEVPDGSRLILFEHVTGRDSRAFGSPARSFRAGSAKHPLTITKATGRELAIIRR